MQTLTDPSFKNDCACGCGAKVRRKWHKGHSKRSSGADYLEEAHGYETPCWIWQLAVAPNGYGHIHGKNAKLAHRAYYEMHKGPIPSGLVVHHKCGVKSCVNPDHLEAVTQSENIRAARSELTNAVLGEMIHRRLAGEPLIPLAEEFGVAPSYLSVLVRGAEAVLD